jgi:hypothetical protein
MCDGRGSRSLQIALCDKALADNPQASGSQPNHLPYPFSDHTFNDRFFESIWSGQ